MTDEEKIKEIRKLIAEPKLFGEFTEHDKDCLIGDICEIVG